MTDYVIHFANGKQKTVRHVSYDHFINIGDRLEYAAAPDTIFVFTGKIFRIDLQDKLIEVVIEAE